MGKVINIQTTGGLGITAKTADGVIGLIGHAPAASGGQTYVLGNIYKLGATVDLIALGIDAAYDATTSTNVYQTISEIFTQNPAATIYLQLVAQTTIMKDMFDLTLATSAIKLINAAESEVKLLGGMFSPTYVPVVDFTTDLTEAIGKAQALRELCKTTAKPIHVFLEAYDVLPTVDFRGLNAPGVSIFNGQSGNFYSTAVYAQKHKAIGVLLGIASKAAVNENVGWVGKFNLVADGLTTARINGVLVQDVPSATIDTMDTNGQIYFMKYSDDAGIYLNDSFTCTVATDDFSTIENNRTWNKASRLSYAASLPFVNGTVLIDSATGQLDSTTVSVIEAAGNKALRVMFQDGEISGPNPQGPTPPYQIDPNQDVLALSEIVGILGIVPTGVSRIIKNYIGLINPNN